MWSLVTIIRRTDIDLHLSPGIKGPAPPARVLGAVADGRIRINLFTQIQLHTISHTVPYGNSKMAG